MAKNAAKKRRSGTRKVSKKLKNTFRYKKPDISSAVVRERWDSNLTAETNMAKMGLRQSANRDIRAPARRAAASAAPGGKIVESCEVSRLFDVADTADLKVIDRNYGRRPMSDEDQRYMAKLLSKHGFDHEAMARDIKVNYNQLTLGQLGRMCDTLLSLDEEQRVVALPERVANEAAKAASNTAAGGAAAGTGTSPCQSERVSASTPVAMEVGEESGDDGKEKAQENRSKGKAAKKKKRKA
ncbi:unnamed protein product [Ectocarpus sp. 12 AP-2014]